MGQDVSRAGGASEDSSPLPVLEFPTDIVVPEAPIGCPSWPFELDPMASTPPAWVSRREWQPPALP